MNKNTIIGIVLIFGLFIGYSIYMQPSKEQLEARQRQQDSLRIEQLNQIIQDSIVQANETVVNEQQQQQQFIASDSVNHHHYQNQNLTSNYGSFSLSAENRHARPVIIENELYRIRIGSKGGKIESVELKEVKTYDGNPVVLFDADSNNKAFGFSFASNYLVINTNDLYFKVITQGAEDTVRVNGNDSVQIAMRLFPNKNEYEIDTASYVEFLYTVRGNDYRTGLKIQFFNMNNHIDRNQTETVLVWETDLLQQEKNRKNEITATTIFFSDKNDVENLKESPDKGDSINHSTRLKWVSFKQQFFTSTIIADDFFSNATMVVNMPQEPAGRTLKNMRAELTLPLEGKDQTFGLSFYFGPNRYKTLKQYDIGLERQIQLGGKLVSWINKWAVIPIFDFFERLGWHYGLIILILTIILKTVLLPLTYTSYISSAKMRVMKPEIDEISQRYPKQEDAMKKQQAIMGLYRQVGIKPMAGCLPVLLQMPILIAMFRFFPSAYELRQQSLFWADDLSAYDSIFSWEAHIPLISTFYGNHISLFTLLMTAATLAYTVMNNKMMAGGMGGNPQQMKMMKWMMYLMPIMFLGIFNNFASGLSYYYLLVNLITFVQMGLFRLLVDEKKLHRRLQANKAKPVTKSNWQKRLEEMAKKQQAMAAAQRNANNGMPQTKQRSNTSLHNKKKK